MFFFSLHQTYYWRSGIQRELPADTWRTWPGRTRWQHPASFCGSGCFGERRCVLFRHKNEATSEITMLIRKQLCLVLWANMMKRKHSLFELLVHGQDGRVAHKGEGQDGNSIDRLVEGAGSNINKLKQYKLKSWWWWCQRTYLWVVDKVFWRACVLAVIHSGCVQVGQADVQHLAQAFIQSIHVFRQRATDLELLDNYLEDRQTDFKVNFLHHGHQTEFLFWPKEDGTNSVNT